MTILQEQRREKVKLTQKMSPRKKRKMKRMKRKMKMKKVFQTNLRMKCLRNLKVRIKVTLITTLKM